MKHSSSIFSTFFLVLFCAAIAQPVQAGDWKLLGEKQVTRRAETDIITVGSKKGALKQIQFRVRGAGVEFKRVVVHYKNGQSKEIVMKGLVKKNTSSRVIDLPGKARLIDRVNFWYQTRGAGKAQATVLLWGKSV